MQIVLSLSKVSEELLWTTYSEHLNPIELKHICKKIFGKNVDCKKSPIGILKSRTSELKFVPSGEEGVVCIFNDKTFKQASDFMQAMKPVPVRTPFGAGDFYVSFETEGRKLAYLVWSKMKDQLVYFPDVSALEEYYSTLGVSPGVDRMKAYPSRRIFG